MSAGDIRHPAYATRAKEYVWSTLKDVFGSTSTPTDIDGMIERRRCYFLFEGKTAGKHIDAGQARAHRNHLLDLPYGRAVFVVGEHGALDRVDVNTSIRRVNLAWKYDEDRLLWSGWINGNVISIIGHLFWTEASNSGALAPWHWSAQCSEMMRPFEAVT